MRPPAILSTVRRRGAVFALVALASSTVACSSPPEESTDPMDVAGQLLDDFVDDSTMISGFTIGGLGIRVVSGTPAKQHWLYPESSTTRPPANDTAQPPSVRGADFPLAESVDRARELAGQCPDLVNVEVQVLSTSAVVTRAICPQDDEFRYAVLLNDQTLPAVQEPISTAAVETVWAEIDAAGLSDRLLRVEFERSDDEADIFFTGPDHDRTYQWSRGLAETNSHVLSHQATSATDSRLSEVSGPQVAAALTQALTTVADPATVDRITVEADRDGSIRLVLADLAYNELATVPVRD